ncbi:MAG: alpha/beta hydrolase [Deltaproteobacteria bacterium]|nr:alpha/beta hydrolase [Deltaproteobacteria bacterium]
MSLDPVIKTLLDGMAAAGGPALGSQDVAATRAAFDNMPLPKKEIALASVENRKIPGPAGEIPIRIYQPHGAGVKPVLVYIHGGGWVIGTLDSYDATCRELAQGAGCVVVSVDYRLAPENRYPAAPDDCYAALKWVAANAASLGADAKRLAVGGDSAGGNLSAVVSQMARDKGGPAIRFQLLIYPVTDADFTRGSYVSNAEGYLLTTASMHWFWDHYLPDKAKRAEAYASPLRAKDLSGLPAAWVCTAEFDPLRDEGEAYAKRLQDAGVATQLTRFDGLIHGFVTMGLVAPKAQAAVDEAVAALKKGLGG